MKKVVCLLLSISFASMATATEQTFGRLNNTERSICKQTERTLASCVSFSMKFYNCQPKLEGENLVVSGNYRSPFRDDYRYIVTGKFRRGVVWMEKIKRPGIIDEFIPIDQFKELLRCD